MHSPNEVVTLDSDDETATDGDSSDESSDGGDRVTTNSTQDYSWELHRPPTVEVAKVALEDLQNVLRPWRTDKTQTGYVDPKLNPVLEECLRAMKDFLVIFTDLNNNLNFVGGQWQKAVLQTA